LPRTSPRAWPPLPSTAHQPCSARQPRVFRRWRCHHDYQGLLVCRTLTQHGVWVRCCAAGGERANGVSLDHLCAQVYR
jgi:hypothetical protein